MPITSKDYVVQNLRDCIDSVSQSFDILESVNETLREENKHLKSEHYKDKELQKMSAELAEAREDLYRGFGISKEESESIKGWIDEHEKTKHNNPERLPRGGAVGGCYKYTFIPTGIGIIGEIQCSCGETFTFQDLI